jgi:competence protein ComEC
MVKIHFLNVGHGDCIIIENFDTNRNTIIDINRNKEFDKITSEELKEQFNINHYNNCNSDLYILLESKGYNIKLTDPIEYLKKYKIFNVHRFISTHPHMDHISGIQTLYYQIGFTNIWISEHNWKPNESKLNENQKLDWEFYEELKNNESKVITRVKPLEGSTIEYLHKDGLKILSPNKELLKSNNANDLSYVILFEYANKKIIFGGDAEEKSWKYIDEKYGSELKNIDILKASHHGRNSGYYQPIVKKMNPRYTIVSVGKKPSTDASNKYRQYCDNVWSTRWKGNIVFEIHNNGEIEYNWEYER